MYIARRPFSYRGVRYSAGDKVSAENWPFRRALLATKRIQLVQGEAAIAVERKDPQLVSKMKRSELEAYASSLGIESPTDTTVYPNRESLIRKIEETLFPSGDTGGSDSDSPPPAEKGESSSIFVPKISAKDDVVFAGDVEGDVVSTGDAEGDVDPFADLETEDDDFGEDDEGDDVEDQADDEAGKDDS